jgi:hypothetical protein
MLLIGVFVPGGNQAAAKQATEEPEAAESEPAE